MKRTYYSSGARVTEGTPELNPPQPCSHRGAELSPGELPGKVDRVTRWASCGEGLMHWLLHNRECVCEPGDGLRTYWGTELRRRRGAKRCCRLQLLRHRSRRRHEAKCCCSRVRECQQHQHQETEALR